MSPYGAQKGPVVVEETYIRRLTYDEPPSQTEEDDFADSVAHNLPEPVAPKVSAQMRTQIQPRIIQERATSNAGRHFEPAHSEPATHSRDEIERRLVSNQRRRRELMQELQALDAEQMELINLLQNVQRRT